MAEPTSDINIPRAHAQTIGEKAGDLTAAIVQKVVDKFGLDPSKKSVEQQFKDEFGPDVEKSLQQIYHDKLSSDDKGRSTSEKVHRASLALQDIVHQAAIDAHELVKIGENSAKEMIKLAEADELAELSAAAALATGAAESRKLEPKA
jgi:hypothetical protein